MAQTAPKYTLKQKYNYHKRIADTGYDKNGEKVGMTSRVRHAQSAIKTHKKLNRFMKTGTFIKNVKSQSRTRGF